MRNRAAVIGVVILFVLVSMSAAAPLVSSYAPDLQDLGGAVHGPSGNHFMGTDQLGRDLWSRVVYGGRISLFSSVLTVTISLILGTSIGLGAGYFGGTVDNILMRMVDVLLAFPALLLALALSVALGTGLKPALIAAIVVSVPINVRIARGVALSVRRLPYIDSARASGAGSLRILLLHVLPNSLDPIIVQGTLQLSSVLLLIAALGYLGLGVQPPTPEWGTLVANGHSYLQSAPYISTLPGLVLVLAVLGFNLLGDGLRDAFDVRQVF